MLEMMIYYFVPNFRKKLCENVIFYKNYANFVQVYECI